MRRTEHPCVDCCVLAKLIESQLVPILLLIFRDAVATLLPSLHPFAALASVVDAFYEHLGFEDVLRN